MSKLLAQLFFNPMELAENGFRTAARSAGSWVYNNLDHWEANTRQLGLSLPRGEFPRLRNIENLDRIGFRRTAMLVAARGTGMQSACLHLRCVILALAVRLVAV